jgi:murein DD-endopeptidase MepM/ murein hydrolase activator NlpD
VPVATAPNREPILPIPLNGVVTVGQGETLYTIAARYQVSPLAIVEDNEISPPYMVSAGQRLKLKPQRFHIVFPGDSANSIAERYGVTEAQIATANALEVPLGLTIGQQLILPAEPYFAISGKNLDGGTSSANAAASPNSQGATATTQAPPRKRFVAPVTGGAYMWPVKGEVIAEFGPAARGVHNDGINIAAPEGTEIVSAAAGTVAFIGKEIKSFGTLVLIKHKDGVISAYAHLGEVLISEGEEVAIGQRIAKVGQTGKVDTPQLHFEIRKARRPLDPRSLIG